MQSLSKSLYELAGAESRDDLAALAKRAEAQERALSEVTLTATLSALDLKGSISRAANLLKEVMTPEQVATVEAEAEAILAKAKTEQAFQNILKGYTGDV